MQVFISWSGHRSKALGACLRDWLVAVVQASHPWMSDQDIDAGQRWNNEVSSHLRESNFGVICLTPENLTSAWILFEAGALAKSLESARVVPVLLDVPQSQIPSPLLQFQSVAADREGLLKLARAINRSVGNAQLPGPTLEVLFNALWPALEKNLSNILEQPAALPAPGSSRGNPDEARTVIEEIKHAFDSLSQYIGRPVPAKDRDQVLADAAMIVAPLRKMQQRLKDWGEASNDWISDFHMGLRDYALIFATDVVKRSSIGSPRFDRYLRMQYAARLRSIQKQTTFPLPRDYSERLHDAIQRTGWQRAPVLRLPSLEPEPADDSGLQIIRILLRPLTVLDAWERDALYVIDFDHQLHGIPLFVVDADRFDESEASDFAIGFGGHGKVRKCYEFEEQRGVVSGQPIKRANELRKSFLKMLDDPTLKTVGEYLGNVMIRDPEKSIEFALDYDSRRRPSNQIVEFIMQRLGPAANNEAGLDAGCGTGNYTFPFARRFQTVTGLDINDSLLDIARSKAATAGISNLRFNKADAVCTPFKDATFDAVWSVSAMHYLRGRRQYCFLQECHRILKTQGVIVIDVGEFLDQHPSLWACEYFPSLKQRYKDSLFSAHHYTTWLGNIGFKDIQCVSMDYKAGEGDLFIRAGQHNPGLYLSEEFIKANPAFVEMSTIELRSGQDTIREHMKSGELARTIERCRREATMSGDLGFIVAVR
jgi:ubiquinone/menaquinone biosynthesis C-methylase UbiE